MGDSAVGKSSIMLRATKNMFNQEHQLTIGVDFGGIAGRIGDDIIKMQVWDTVGLEDNDRQGPSSSDQSHASSIATLIVLSLCTQLRNALPSTTSIAGSTRCRLTPTNILFS